MNTRQVDVPEDLLALLARTRLGSRPEADQVRMALAIHLFQQGLISVGRAAELAGEPRAPFELLLGKMGIPPVRYDVEDYRADFEAIQQARAKKR
jgi:predicted HTH domain antitoxin